MNEKKPEVKLPEIPIKKRRKRRKMDPTRFVFICIVVIFIVFASVISIGVGYFKKITDDMYNTYIKNTREVIMVKEEIEATNAWERLPLNQQKEILRKRYNEIISYYSVDVPENQKISSKQTLDTFNVLFNCISSAKSVNFFLPIAYMKVKTNFNPNFDVEWQYGISAFYVKEGKNIANLLLIRENESFNVAYKGKITLQNPTEAIKLLVAKMDDLMDTFGNREDWVVLSLLTNEYDVIDKYWNDGKGKLPDRLYEKGDMKNILDYFYAFRNLKIIPIK